MSTDAKDRQPGGDHYKNQEIQPIAYMASCMSREEFEGFCKGNVLKYVSRAGKKGDKKLDLDKAIHYLQFWREALQADNGS